jgi:hypothetical protein
MKNENDLDTQLKSLLQVVNSNGQLISTYGGYLVALGRFAETVIPLLDDDQCVELRRRYRLAIEEIMHLTDDRAMPAEYELALLNQTNCMLKALNERNES